jgi:hypothetical protein
MSRPPLSLVKLSDTLILSECHDGWWLYDKTGGMNLSMRAKTSTDAFVEALTYYQKRLMVVEHEYTELNSKVNAFVDQFREEHNHD